MEDSSSTPSATNAVVDDAVTTTTENVGKSISDSGDGSKSNNDDKTEATAFEDSAEISSHNESVNGDSDGKESDNEKIASTIDPPETATPTTTTQSSPTTTSDKVVEESKKEVEDGASSDHVDEASDEGKEEGKTEDGQQLENDDKQVSENRPKVNGTTTAVAGAFSCSSPPSLVKGSAIMMDTNSATRAANQETTSSAGSLLLDNEEETSGYMRQHASVMKPMEEGETSRTRAQQPGAVSVKPLNSRRQAQQLGEDRGGNTDATSRATSNNPEKKISPHTQRQELAAFETEITSKLRTSVSGTRSSTSPSSPKPQRQELAAFESEITSKLRTSPIGTRSALSTSSPKPQRQELDGFESEITSKLRTSPIGTTRSLSTSRAELESFSNEIAAKSRSSAMYTSKSQGSPSTVNSTYNYSPRRRISPGAVYIPPDEDDMMLSSDICDVSIDIDDDNGASNRNADSDHQGSNGVNGTGQQPLDTHRQQCQRLTRTSLRDSKRMSSGTIAAIPLESWNILEEEERLKELEERASKLQYELDNAPRAEVVGSTLEFQASATQLTRESSMNQGGDLSERSEEQNKQSLWCKVLLMAVLILLIVVIVVAVVLSKSSSSEKQLEGSIEDKFDETNVPTMSPTSLTPESFPPTLQRIHERGYVKCRGSPDEVESGVGFSVDMCSAIAAVVLGDKTKFELPYIAFRDQFDAVVNGTVDISTAQTTPTMQRDILEPLSKYGMAFTRPYFYSGTTFAGVPEFVECADQGDTLQGVCRDLSVCVVDGSVTQDLVRDMIGGTGTHSVTTRDDLFLSLADGTCNVITGAPMIIYDGAAAEFGYTGPYAFAPRFYNRDPLALTTRNDDPEFGDMVNWMLRALIVAEALNITQDNAAEFPTTDVFGEEYAYLFQNAISAVGNFGELYSRTWEDRVPRRLGGINSPHLTSDHGGLLYPNPLGKIDDFDSALDAQQSTSLGPIPNGTLEEIDARQELRCGIIVDGTRQPGLAQWNSELSAWEGVDVDYCRGIAAAVLAGDVSLLVLVPYDSMEDGFSALANHEVEILAGAVYNMVNDVREPTTGVGFGFSDIYYYHVDDKNDDADVVLPFALATRQPDVQWNDFVRSMVAATVHAEAAGITKATAIEMPLFELFGADYRQALRDIILSVGNYAEIYERNVEMYLPRVDNVRNTLNTGGNPMFFANWRFD